MKIRIVKTASKAKAVQVVHYIRGKRKILQHIGSAHTQEALNELLHLAEDWMKDYDKQLSIFPEDNPNQLLHLSHSTFLGVKYRFFYQQIGAIQRAIGLDDLPIMLNDLVVMRIFEPASKLRSLELLQSYFGIYHSRKTFYKIAPQCLALKTAVENKILSFAKAQYCFDFDLLFYDVTTLYFELSEANHEYH